MPFKFKLSETSPTVSPFFERSDEFCLDITKTCADKVYDCAVVHHVLERQRIEGYISPVSTERNIEAVGDKPFLYDEQSDHCVRKERYYKSHVEDDGIKDAYRRVYAAKIKHARYVSNVLAKRRNIESIGVPLFSALVLNINRMIKAIEAFCGLVLHMR